MHVADTGVNGRGEQHENCLAGRWSWFAAFRGDFGETEAHVETGSRPILWHVMNINASHRFTDDFHADPGEIRNWLEKSGL